MAEIIFQGKYFRKFILDMIMRRSKVKVHQIWLLVFEIWLKILIKSKTCLMDISWLLLMISAIQIRSTIQSPKTKVCVSFFRMVPALSFVWGKNQSIKDSGTGSQGATIRIYVEKYSVDNLDMPTEEAVSDLIEIALKLSMLEEYTGRKTPTVITWI